MTPDAEGDRISIRDLEVTCVIGVNPEERTGKQPLILGVELFTDLSTAGISDSIEDTIDYAELTDRIAGYVERSSWLLIEKLAEEVARICLSLEAAQGVTVTVEKPGALKRPGKVSVRIYRKKVERIEET